MSQAEQPRWPSRHALLLLVLASLLAGALAAPPRRAQAATFYALPCRIEASGNWATVRGALRTSDQGLIGNINTVGLLAHASPPALPKRIDLNARTANRGPRTYGVCQDLTVRAARAGTVVFAGDTAAGWPRWGGGWTVAIDHGGGHVSHYAHMQAGSLTVSAGQQVAEGAPLGTMGMTGNATGVHLHFEVLTRVFNSPPYGYQNDWEFSSPIAIPPALPTGDFAPGTRAALSNATIGRMVSLDAVVGALPLRKLEYTLRWGGEWRIMKRFEAGLPYSAELDLCSLGVPDGDLEFGIDLYATSGTQSLSPNGTLRARKQFDCAPPCRLKPNGDINCDGSIDLLDFSVFREDFIRRQDGTHKASDVNGDGEIDLLDFEAFRQGYLACRSGQLCATGAEVAGVKATAAPPIISLRNARLDEGAGAIEVDVYADGPADLRLSGVTSALTYASHLIDFDETTPGDYQSAACAALNQSATGALRSLLRVEEDAAFGTLRISRSTTSSNDSLPSGQFCVGTLRFTIAAADEPLAAIRLDSDTARWQLVGPQGTVEPQIDETSSAVYIELPGALPPEPSVALPIVAQ